MTPSVKYFLDIHLRSLPRGSRVLDVGSFNVNGKPDAMGLDYVGLDMRDGPNVDVVCNAHHLPFGDAEFDGVVCAETLEHDDEPLRTLAEIRRVLKPGGMFLMTVAGVRFPKHDYPSDYWRVTAEGARVWLRGFGKIHGVDEVENGVRAVAFK